MNSGITSTILQKSKMGCKKQLSDIINETWRCYSRMCLSNSWCISLGLVTQFYFVAICTFQIERKQEATGLWSLISPWYTESRGNVNGNDLVMNQPGQESDAPAHCRDKCFWQHLAGADHRFSETRISTALIQLKLLAKEIFPSAPWVHSPSDTTNSTDSVYRQVPTL